MNRPSAIVVLTPVASLMTMKVNLSGRILWGTASGGRSPSSHTPPMLYYSPTSPTTYSSNILLSPTRR